MQCKTEAFTKFSNDKSNKTYRFSQSKRLKELWIKVISRSERKFLTPPFFWNARYKLQKSFSSFFLCTILIIFAALWSFVFSSCHFLFSFGYFLYLRRFSVCQFFIKRPPISQMTVLLLSPPLKVFPEVSKDKKLLCAPLCQVKKVRSSAILPQKNINDYFGRMQQK